MTGSSTTVVLLVPLACWLISVGCHEPPPIVNHENKTTSVNDHIGETGNQPLNRQEGRRSYAAQPFNRIPVHSTHGSDAGDHMAQGASLSNKKEAPPNLRGNNDSRPIQTPGGSGTQDLSDGGAEDHGHSHSREPQSPGPKDLPDGGADNHKYPRPGGHDQRNPSDRQPEDHGHSHSRGPQSHGPKSLPDGGADDHKYHRPGGHDQRIPSDRRPEDHDHEHSREPQSPGSNLLPGGGVEDHSTHEAEEEEDLCHSLCLCSHDDSVVSCEHEHLDNDHIHNLMLSARSLPQNVETFRVIGFEKLEILPGTFADHKTIERITFKGIDRLILHPGSLYFPQNSEGNTKVEMSIENCTIPLIPEGAITQNATRHDSQTIQLGLEDTRYLTLHFERCSIGVLSNDAIADARFMSFFIKDSKIDSVQPRSIDVDVYEEFEMSNTALPTLPRNSVNVRSDGVVVISRNVLNRVEGFAFNVTSDSQVLFERNHVKELEASALMGVVPQMNARGASIVFLDNEVETAAPESLMINRRYQAHERKVLNNKFDVHCTCNISEVFGDFLNTSNFEDAIFLAVMDNSLCMREDSGTYLKVKEFMAEECNPFNKFIFIAAGVVLAIILILTVVIVVCWQRVKKLKEENSYATEGSTRSFSTLRSCPPLSPGVKGPPSFEGRTSPSLIMAIPEIKTYQETEVHMPYDRTETMDSSKLSYSGSPYHSYRSSEGRTGSPYH